MAPIASRFVAASALFASTVGGVDVDSCAEQSACITWEMTPSINECTANPVINPNNKQCPGRWKVCMTVTQNINGDAPECPAAFIHGRCPSELCELGRPVWPQQTHSECQNQWPIGGGNANDRTYCQYGEPGEQLFFKVMDGVGGIGDCTGPAIPPTATIITVNHESCTAAVACKAGDDDSKDCDTGCSLRARPCVHVFTVPNNCACTDTTTSSSSTRSSSTTPSTTHQKPHGVVFPGAIESMPNKPQGLALGDLGLGEARVSGMASPAVLAAGVALGVAAVAAAVVAMARRGTARVGAVQATGESEEAFLPEQLEG